MRLWHVKSLSIIILFVILIPGCRKNRPPSTPYTPSGPHIALLNVTYQFGSLAIDPNGDNVAIRFDWGDEDTSEWSGWFASGEEIWTPNSWSDFGIYYVRAQAKDIKDKTSEWSLPHYVIVAQNHPPNVPSISGPSSGYIYLPYTFTSSTTDPDYDSIAIRFDWGNGETSEWSGWIASGDSVQVSHSWLNAGTYNVRTQAKDKNESFSEWSLPHPIEISLIPEMFWVLGGCNNISNNIYNDVWYSPDGANWTCATESAPWSPRDGHTSVVFDNKIWVIGGCDTNNNLRNDVWYSTNGVNWTCATSSAEWSPRWGHTSVVFDNKIWVIGGEAGSSVTEKNDVWYSSDGTNWTRATASAEWTARVWHTSVVFDNKIFIAGGGTVFADVWCTTNGSEWTCATDSAWPSRWGHESVSFNNKIWILGGCAYFYIEETTGTRYGWEPDDDVWCSPNGIGWICETESAEWPKREYFASVAFDNKIWVIGGTSSVHELNDVWYSINGINWTCATPSAEWRPRRNHTSVVFKIGCPN